MSHAAHAIQTFRARAFPYDPDKVSEDKRVVDQVCPACRGGGHVVCPSCGGDGYPRPDTTFERTGPDSITLTLTREEAEALRVCDCEMVEDDAVWKSADAKLCAALGEQRP